MPQGTLGGWLRQQREARGVSLREIADASKISVRYLEALEQDRFDVLPAPVFAKGFLREYARVVGLDADEAVNLYLLSQGSVELPSDEPVVAEPLARRSATPSTWGYGLLLTLAVVLFLGVAALLSYWAGRRRAETPPAPPEIVATYAATPRPEPPPAATPLPEGMVVGPVATATAEPPAADEPLRVTLEFAEDCWVEIVVDGRRRTSELRAGGETLQIEADKYVLLTLGNSRAVRAEVDGRPYPLPADGARVVRDLRIERPAPAGETAD